MTLGRVAPRTGAKLLYRYDLGDDWQHDIVVEDILPADPTMHCPALPRRRAGRAAGRLRRALRLR